MVVHFFTAASIVFLVLLQRGKGADAGAGFGAGASGTVFGARGAGTALSRTTAILAGNLMITSRATYVDRAARLCPRACSAPVAAATRIPCDQHAGAERAPASAPAGTSYAGCARQARAIAQATGLKSLC
jgi:preprotein translocase subunit SecG